MPLRATECKCKSPSRLEDQNGLPKDDLLNSRIRVYGAGRHSCDYTVGQIEPVRPLRGQTPRGERDLPRGCLGPGGGCARRNGTLGRIELGIATANCQDSTVEESRRRVVYGFFKAARQRPTVSSRIV